MTANKVTCPICGSGAPELLKLDGGFKQRLRESGQSEPIPEAVCGSCFGQFSATVSQGAQLRVIENAKQQQRMTMWRNRMDLIKQARSKMEAKSFAEAAVLYEKYLRILEIVYESTPGGLNPEMFKNKARSKELTLITSVYWDLVRIYDSSDQFRERLEKSVAKLMAFAPSSGILPKLSGHAANYMKHAKNADIFRKLEKDLGIKRKGCFIATAVFESEDAPEVVRLRKFRDEYLETNLPGRLFTETYYWVSPKLVPHIQRSKRLKKILRRLLS